MGRSWARSALLGLVGLAAISMLSLSLIASGSKVHVLQATPRRSRRYTFPAAAGGGAGAAALARWRRAHLDRLAAPTSRARLLSASMEDASPEFDWRAYLTNYPELLQPPDAVEYSESAARRHYERVGRAQGRVASRLSVRFRYTGANASPGLTNQLLAHLSAFMIADAAGAEVVVPPFVSRRAFVEPAEWMWQPAESVLDIDRMAEYWGPRGLVIHRTPELSAAQRAGYPQLLERNSPALALYGPGDEGCASAILPHLESQLQTVAQRVRRLAVFVAENWLKKHGTAPDCVNVDTGHIFFRVPVASDQNLALSLFRGFFFNRTVVDLAAAVKAAAGGRFHAAHLRIEDDANGWNQWGGGASGALQEYVRVMRNASFTHKTTVYVASGLLYNGATSSPELEAAVLALRGAGVAGRVVYKEQVVERAELQGLHSEQLALADLLVMAGAQAFVGHPFSTMSAMVEQLRINAGFPPESNRYIYIWEKEHDGNAARFARFVRFAHGYRPRVRHRRLRAAGAAPQH